MFKRRSIYIYGACALLLFLLIESLLPNIAYGQQITPPVKTKSALAALDRSSTTQDYRLPRPVRIGFYENPPKIYTSANGDIVGFWPDLVAFIAAEEGWEVVWVPGTWEENLARLERSEIDIMPDVAWSEPRSQIYTFSTQKVLVSWSRLYVQKGTNIETVLDLDGKTVAGLAGSVNYDGVEGIKDIASQFDIHMVFVDKDNYTEVFEAINDGTVDAGVTNRDFGNQNISNYNNIERSSFIFQPAHIEFAFPKDGELTPLLLERVDAQIQTLKAAETSIYYESLAKYLEGGTAETIIEIIPDWVQNLFLLSGSLVFFLLAVGITSRVQVRRQTAALHKSEESYRNLFEHATDGIFIANQSGHYIDVNMRGCAMLGYTRQEILNLHISKLVAPEELTTTPIPMEDLLAGKSIISERTLMHKNGTRIPVEISSRFMPDGNLQGIVRDITERKEAQAALKKSEDLFSKAFHGCPAPMAIVRSADGIYVAVNESFLNLIEYEREDVIGKTSLELNLIDVKKRSETIQTIEQTGNLYNIELQGRTKTGQHLDLLYSIEHVELAGEACVIITMIDITERKKAQAERERLITHIREQAWQLELILETVPTGVFLLDAKGRILLANPIAEHNLALLAGAKVGEILTGLGNHSLNELLTSPPTKGLWHEVKIGGRYFEVIARPMETGPEPGHWVLVINETTRDREIQLQLLQQERLASVGQLAAGIAHDFNNIMAIIILYSQMLTRSEGITLREQERLLTINEQAWHASRLIEQILDFSRQAMLEMNPLDLLPLLKEQVKLLKRTLPEHIAVDFFYTGQEYTINADPTRMQQIITNLAVNARDAMPNGGTLRFDLEKITVKLGQLIPLPEMKTGNWIKLSVTDNGTGIPPEVLSRIFEPFFTTKGPGEGSGLGLAQVHGIVGQHDGHINVDTNPGQGTVFTIYLPELDTSPGKRLLASNESFPLGQGELVLVVEDEAILRAALVSSLEELNYRTLQAANGREALAYLVEQGEQIDLVLSDVIMPEMGGKALFHAIKKNGWQIPLILLTGHPLDKQFAELQSQGLTAWLTKPPNLERLAHALATTLRGGE